MRNTSNSGARCTAHDARKKNEEGSPHTVHRSRHPASWLSKLMPSALFLLTLPLTGCQISYLFQAAAGQFRFLYDAVPVEVVLQQDSLSADEKRRLSLVSRIKEFGENELGLKKSDNYETINLKDQSPVYTVSASPKDKLALVTWWFPVVGD